MLSIATEATGDIVYIHADATGIAELEAVVASLKKGLLAGECPHEHLYSPAWGGNELSETMLNQERDAGCKQVHHVKLYAWSPEWASKHGLCRL